MDNGSPGSRASAIAVEVGARAVRSANNQGFAPAVAAGAQRARGDILAFLNDDAVAAADWVATAAKALAQPNVAAVGPKIVLAGRFREVSLPDTPWKAPGDGRSLGRQLRSVTVDGLEVLAEAGGPGLHRLEGVGTAGTGPWRWTSGPEPWYVPLRGQDQEGGGQHEHEVLVNGEPVPPGPLVSLVNSAGAFLDSRGYAGDIGADEADDSRFDEPAERFALSGCALVVRAGTWNALGPFAPQYFAYYEDIDWCWRARLAGMKLVYDPAATVSHQRSASSGGKHQPWVRVMAERNRTLTMVRNGPQQLVVKALADRARQGPDGGVRAGVARLLPWALETRAKQSRQWAVRPEEVWSTWSGTGAPLPE